MLQLDKWIPIMVDLAHTRKKESSQHNIEWNFSHSIFDLVNEAMVWWKNVCAIHSALFILHVFYVSWRNFDHCTTCYWHFVFFHFALFMSVFPFSRSLFPCTNMVYGTIYILCLCIFRSLSLLSHSETYFD